MISARPAPASAAGERLAQRLRTLRERGLGTRLTQEALATAFGVSVATISTWENPSSGKIPPHARLDHYARLFATPRSVVTTPPTLFPDTELSEGERRQMELLRQDLRRLRSSIEEGKTARGEVQRRPSYSPILTFPDEAPITILCTELPPNHRGKYADADEPNYSPLFRFADPESLLTLHTALHVYNPSSEIAYLTSSDLDTHNPPTHLVVVGGPAWNRATDALSSQLGLPVWQRVSKEDELDVFVTPSDHEFQPHFSANGRLVQDTGLFVRAIHPHDPTKVVLICSGIFTHGVLAMARLFWDKSVRSRNEEYITARFGTHPFFAVLARVRVLAAGRSATPDLSDPSTVHLSEDLSSRQASHIDTLKA